MRMFMLITLSVILVFVLVSVYQVWGRSNAVIKELSVAKTELDATQTSRDALRAELDYLVDPANLEKELKTRFNFKKPGEKMIILVPDHTTSTATTTPFSTHP